MKYLVQTAPIVVGPCGTIVPALRSLKLHPTLSSMPNATPLAGHTLLPQQFYIGLTAITIICVQFLNLLMSLEPSGGSEKAHWNDKETEALLDHLIMNKTLGQGNGNFKDQVFTSAVEAISGFLSIGPVKTARTCKNKWTTVSSSCYLLITAYRSTTAEKHFYHN